MGVILSFFRLVDQQLDLPAFPKSKTTAQDFLASVSNYVSTNKGQIVPLKKPSGAKLRIADVDDTIYRDDEDQVYAWGNFFLPQSVHMQVFAVVEDVLCAGEQLILMTCEDKQVYAYDDEVLHLVALSLEELLDEGLRCPAYEKYYEGNAFIHMVEIGHDLLASVLKFVSTNKGRRLSLKKPSGAKLRIADVDGTVYRDDEDQVYAWGNFFLPQSVHMQVFAVVEDVLCAGEQLILMTCEDKQVYAYDDEVLHLVALSLEQLLDEGLRCPAYKNYYEGDAFNHMTEEDWAKEKQSPFGKDLDKKHHQLVDLLKPKVLEILRSTKSKQELTNANMCQAQPRLVTPAH